MFQTLVTPAFTDISHITVKKPASCPYKPKAFNLFFSQQYQQQPALIITI